MGFHKVIYLYCDGNSPDCATQGDEASWGDTSGVTLPEYREMAKNSGWLLKKGNKAYCPACREALKKDKKNGH